MSRTDQAIHAARLVSNDDAEYFRAATGLLEALCRELEAARPEALLIEVARIAIAKYKLHAGEFSEEAIIKDAVDAARSPQLEKP